MWPNGTKGQPFSTIIRAIIHFVYLVVVHSPFSMRAISQTPIIC